jgi:hypothetical protein
MIKTGLVLLVSLFVYFVLWAGDDIPHDKNKESLQSDFIHEIDVPAKFSNDSIQ